MVVQSERSIGDFSALTFRNNNPSPDIREKIQRLEEGSILVRCDLN